MTTINVSTFCNLLLAASAIAFPPLVFAQFYVGGSAGQSMTKFDGSDFELNDPVIAENAHKTKTAYKLFAGYDFNKYLALEGGYVDLGKPSYTYTAGGLQGTYAQNESAWFIAGKGTLPINDQFNVFAKLGVSFNKVKSSYISPSNSFSESINTSDFLYGVGAGYNFTKQLGIRLEYEDFGKFGEKIVVGNGIYETGRTRTAMWSLGMEYKF